MGGKKVWLTWMPAGDEASKPDAVLTALSTYGLQAGGTQKAFRRRSSLAAIRARPMPR